jgi:DNA-binding response OmpR family regulator
MEPKVLIVEDEVTLLETLEYNLQKQGYRVLTASHGRVALQLARQHTPDLILLDVMLPGIDGFELCRILRREMSAPILMLTAKADEIDKIVGLEVGADDYITKPFSMRELLARVKAQLRRVRINREESDLPTEDVPKNDTLVFDNLTINVDRRELLLNEKPLHLKPKEYELLLFLARNKGMALSRDLILERVWGWTNDNSRTVDVHVRWLREKIEPEPSNAQRIVTVRGIGYRFEG